MNYELKYLETKNEKFPFIYTLNVMQSIQTKYGTLKDWSDLIESKNENSEPNIEALIFFFTEAINEGIDIENETAEQKRSFVDAKKVGRIVTEIGILNAGQKLKETVIESSKLDDDNSGESEKN